jgi:hypothetical protein
VVTIHVLDGKVAQEGEQDVIRVKVPNVPIRIVDQENNAVNGESLCLDETDQHNCDLYFFYTVTGQKKP